MSTSAAPEKKTVGLVVPDGDEEARARREAGRSGGEGEKERSRSRSRTREPAGAKWANEQVHVIPKNNLFVVFAGLTLTMFIAALDQTIVATALPTIARDLKGSPSSYSWVGVAYMLLACALSPFYGKFSDTVGRKPVMFGCIVLFLVGSALCGAAQNMTWLCIARGVQGAGGGGLMQLTQIIVSDIVPLSSRGKYSGAIGATWGIAGAIGPLIGGVLSEQASWRWAFYLSLPIGGLGGLILFFFLKLNPIEKTSIRTFTANFDFLGLGTIIAGVTCLLVGFNSGETNWRAPKTIALLVVGAVLLGIAVVIELKTKRSPVIPPRLFKTRTTGLILISVSLHAWAFMAASFYMPVYFQAKGASALMSGILVMPMSIGSAVTSVMSGFAMQKLGGYRLIISSSFFICVLGFALMATLNEDSGVVKEIMYQLIAAIGIGPLFQVPLVALQASMPIKEMGASTGVYTWLRTLGGTISINVCGAIYGSELTKRLTAIGASAGQVSIHGANDLTALKSIEPPALRHSVLAAYTRSISVCWMVTAPLLFVAFLLSLGLRSYSLQRTIVRPGEQAKETESSGAEMEEEPRPTEEKEARAADLERGSTTASIATEKTAVTAGESTKEVAKEDRR